MSVSFFYSLCVLRAKKNELKDQRDKESYSLGYQFGKKLKKQGVDINITGKTIKEPDGYYIEGQTPPEIFRILNPVPKQLDWIVESGRSVKIEAQIVQGDNVNIEKINGKTYQKEGK